MYHGKNKAACYAQRRLCKSMCTGYLKHIHRYNQRNLNICFLKRCAGPVACFRRCFHGLKKSGKLTTRNLRICYQRKCFGPTKKN